MPERHDLVCFSHVRWDFQFQRQNHLMSQAARERRVFFIEEARVDAGEARVDVVLNDEGVHVVVPRVPAGTSDAAIARLLHRHVLQAHGVELPILWFCSPSALPVAAGMRARAVVYDCMEDLTGSLELEDELFRMADVVFTAGQSLCELKQVKNSNIWALPSSVDVDHFARARSGLPHPADMLPLRRPRLGFYGAVDERLDFRLLEACASSRPDWEWVLVGPISRGVAKSLPRRPNLHYPGLKSYDELPAYLASWDLAYLPYASNRSTRYINPSRTLEFLAAGRQVVSTPVRDVVVPYGEQGYVWIAADVASFVRAADMVLTGRRLVAAQRVESFLRKTSWERTWEIMEEHLQRALGNSKSRRCAPTLRTAG